MIEDVIILALAPVFAPAPLIIANQNGPRPATLYGTIRIESMHRLPNHIGPQDVNGVRKVSAHRTGQLEIQMFGVSAYETLDLIMQKFSFDANVEAFEQRGIVFGEPGDLENLPVIRNVSQFDPRAIATVPFSYTRAVDEALSWIETVNGTATIEGSIETVEFSGPYSVTIVDNP